MYIAVEPGLHQTNNNYVEYSRTGKMKKSFARTGALIWNGLPKSLKSLRKSYFKSKIKQILLEFLQN